MKFKLFTIYSGREGSSTTFLNTLPAVSYIYFFLHNDQPNICYVIVEGH